MLIYVLRISVENSSTRPLFILYFVKPSSTNEVLTSSTAQERSQGFGCSLIRELGLERHETVLVLQIFLHNALKNGKS